MSSVHTKRLTIHTIGLAGFFPSSRAHLFLAVPNPMGPVDWPLVTGRVDVLDRGRAAVLNHIAVSMNERRMGYGMEVVAGLERMFGRLHAGWMTTEGVAFARAYIDKHGERDWFLNPDARPESESNDKASEVDVGKMLSALDSHMSMRHA